MTERTIVQTLPTATTKRHKRKNLQSLKSSICGSEAAGRQGTHEYRKKQKHELIIQRDEGSTRSQSWTKRESHQCQVSGKVIGGNA